ncbi:hypothetical protein SLNWT_6221 [Streptomyces albus]|uniref:Uncharacterized protein n=1 Tax=Streptomyces albus (strain ATCC 21838 / DSM 41398 / FERM P-419 / JCM 4703 / NBRC 107858) TaxID=1081613 RepID=A0A0B5F800_STRA4|nr:hypothetical protein SLNWT_6221 [Streptomyces albus]AOU80901.1 hypothetical protein SLNHY_6210 [Streptomyces albus]AYN36605.1 hypothetical protein DUI70_6111 [Streptomyces albus]
MHDVRALLTPAVFGGVVATVIDNNPGMEEGTAERIVVEALKFMDAAAQFPTVKITPSNVVDEGWHALILHTNLYEKLCERLGAVRASLARASRRRAARRTRAHAYGGHHREGRAHRGQRTVDGPDQGPGIGGGELLPHSQARRLRTDQSGQVRFALLGRWR